jgi:hypothetical protein
MANVRSWPNPAIRARMTGCEVDNPAVAATGRNQPIADMKIGLLTGCYTLRRVISAERRN